MYIKAIAEELRGLAVEFDVPIISATQSNRDAYNSSDVGLDNTSESFALPATADFMFALISTEDLEGLNQILVKQLKNRYDDPSSNRKFVIGVNKAKMKFYDVEQSAQKDILDGPKTKHSDKPVMDNSSFGERYDEEQKMRFVTKKVGRKDFSGVKFAAKTTVGRGGMDTKLKAVRKLTPNGVDVIIGTFLIENPLLRLIEGQGGTLFKGNPEKQKSRRKSWLCTIVKNDAWVVVDEGCSEAMKKATTSLLPVGIKKVYGMFKRGDVIQVKHKNKIIAVGISEFDYREMELIKGKKSSEITDLIENAHSKVAIHKDNLLIKSDQ
jgi:hypothetical protein